MTWLHYMLNAMTRECPAGYHAVRAEQVIKADTELWTDYVLATSSFRVSKATTVQGKVSSDAPKPSLELQQPRNGN